MPGGRRRDFFPLKAHVELHTICGRDAAGVQTARAQLGWQNAATDWREVVESPLIDIVDISTPNDSHAEIAIAAAQAGKHVLCEKPLALTVKQAKRCSPPRKRRKSSTWSATITGASRPSRWPRK